MRKSHIGESKLNTFGTKMTIVEQLEGQKIIVEFDDEYKVRKETTLSNFNKRSVLNPYDKTVYGIGYLGEGDNKASTDKGSTRVYYVWRAMLQRCYAESTKNVYPSYYGVCKVCDEWKNFQNYADWHKEHYYKIEGERMHVDKDIINMCNKTYSPDNCIIIPQSINVLFVNQFRNGLLKGIHKVNKGYKVEFKGRKVGVYSTLEEAMLAYGKMRKRNVVEVANKLKHKLPGEVYKTICDWDETSMLNLI